MATQSTKKATAVEPVTAQPVPPAVTPASEKKGFAITSMVLGIVALLLAVLWFISPILAITGLVFGIIALTKKQAGKGMAIAGVILSSVAILVSMIVFTLFVIAIISTDTKRPSTVRMPAQADQSLQSRINDSKRQTSLSSAKYAVERYISANGSLPAVDDVTIENLEKTSGTSLDVPGTTQKFKIVKGESTRTDTIGYAAGTNCDGQAGEKEFHLTVKLERGEVYCRGSYAAIDISL